MMKRIIAFVLVSVLCISLASCSNSKESLEKKLANSTWYREYEGSYGYKYLEVLEFHLNGKRVSKKYSYSNGHWNSAGNSDNLSHSWEIMENRELYFKEKYYKWGDDWSLSGGKLIIGGVEYTNKPKSNYPD